jgi:hypothetical protein
MNRWTSSAKNRLEEYFARLRCDLQPSGADVEEVTADLRRHVEQEVVSLQLGVVTEQDIGAILGRIGVPEPAATHNGRATFASMPGTSTQRHVAAAPKVKPPGGLVLFFGVLLPLGTIIFEFITGACAGVLFDPLPTVAHILLTLAVPASAWWVWMGLKERVMLRPIAMGRTLGLSVAVSAVYSILLLPFSPFALLGVIAYGLGMVPLSPYFALAAVLVLQSKLAERLHQRVSPRFWSGVLIGIGALAVFSTPMLLTRLGLQMATSEAPSTRTKGLALLRSWGRDDDLLRACYGRMGRIGVGTLYTWGRPIDAETARRIYYQVRGHPFNSVPPPKLYTGRARWSVLEQEFEWDNDQGGDAVAARVKGLSLMGSRQDVVVDPDAALAYCEWTLEFKNVSQLQREARAQVLLPPGAAVSRLTLWIDGEEREAAFGGRSQVKQAYKAVVNQRRDPVLVTTCGPDRVLVQCFPVPPAGGVMKARLGITAPLVLSGMGTGLLRLPCLSERNFNIDREVRHLVWLDSPQPVSCASPALTPEQTKGGLHSLRGSLSNSDLEQPSCLVKVERDTTSSRAWARDTRDGEGYLVWQTINLQKADRSGAIVVVIDGTRRMEESYSAIAAALSSLPQGLPISILQAADGVNEIAAPLRPAEPELLKDASKRVRKASIGS